MKTINVGLLGCGTVGTGVAKLLMESRKLIASRLGANLHLKRVADIDVDRDRGIASYRRSLEMNPANHNARTVLAELSRDGG